MSRKKPKTTPPSPLERHCARVKRVGKLIEHDAYALAEEARALQHILNSWDHNDVHLPGLSRLGTNLTNRIKIAVEEELEDVLERIDAMDLP